MKFGPVPLGEAEGAILAHSQQTATGKIAKGTVLKAAHISDLRAAGRHEVTVARLESGDVDENRAAQNLAETIAPDPEAQNLRLSRPGTGRVNLFATSPGIAVLKTDQIAQLNAVDPMITLATVPQYFRVDQNGMVATIKIISYAVSDAELARAIGCAASAISVRPAQFATASLVETQIPGQTPTGKGRAAMAARLERLGVTLTDRIFCDHKTDAIADAVSKAPGEMVFILTGSATSDPEDVAPSGLRSAGGTVIRFGMPVDPGNLLFLGKLQQKPVIGLPGCARSPALNGADWVLERVICGLEVSDRDIAAMGVGGLLKEIPTRPQPRAEI